MIGVLAPKASSNALFANRVRRLGTEAAFKLGDLIRQVESDGQKVIRCNLGQPDFPVPPHVADAVVEALRRGKTAYCDPQGLPELREAIARSAGEARGLAIDPDRVVVYPGARTPIGFAQQAYVRPGDEVLYPSPSYPLFESFVRHVSATPVPLPLREETGFALLAQDLDVRLTPRTNLVYVNSPGNPTGGVASQEELQDIARVILDRTDPSVRVYSDEVYEAILFDGRRHVSIASMPGMEERTIIASGVSKTYSWTGGRVGWAIYPTVKEALLHRNLNINYFASISPYNQIGAKVALESEESIPIIRLMVQAFQHRRDVAVAKLNSIEGITCQVPKGAFYAFPNISCVLDELGAEDAFHQLPPAVQARSSTSTLFQLFLLYRYRVATMDRRSFGSLGSEGQHFLRISIAAPQGKLLQAVERIEQASRDRAGFQAFVRSGRRVTL